MDRPVLRSGSVFVSIFGFWLFYVVIVTLRARVLDLPSQGDLAWRRAIVTLLGILVTVILWRIIRVFDLRPLSVRILVTTTAAMPCALVIASINYYVFNVYDVTNLFDDGVMNIVHASTYASQEIAEVAISRYFFLVAWAALYLAMSYANDVRESERRAALFAAAAQEAELRALRYQVNPHFLFNTLNALSSLVMTDRKAEAETMIMSLSTFFRTSLSSEPSADVTLEEEVTLQKLYLEMEAVRFANRLTIDVDIPEALYDIAVPGLILQPLVENAIKHGVSKTTRAVVIRIEARETENMLEISVMNSGPKSAKPKAERAGIGLVNVRDRLAARFAGEATLETLAPDQGGFIARVTIPVVRA